jgi:hypothetical protein
MMSRDHRSSITSSDFAMGVPCSLPLIGPIQRSGS